MENIGLYLWGTISEGVVIAILFWLVMAVTIETTSKLGALRAALVSEAVGNLPYLFGEPALGPLGLTMTVLGGIVFVRVILQVGELTAMKAAYGVLTTYFMLVAVVACAPAGSF